MMKKMIKILTTGLIIVIMIAYNTMSIGASLNDLQNQQSSVNTKIEEQEKKLEEITTEKSEALTAVENLSSQISSYENEIEDLTEQISSLEKQIQEAEQKIKEDEEQYQKDQAALNERLVTIYENGEISYLDVLLSSSSLTDFISSYYIVSELTAYDTEMLEELEAEKQQIENEKAQMEANQEKVKTAKETQEAKQSALKVAKSEKEQYVSELSEEEQKTQEIIDELEQTNKDIDKQIEAAQAAIEKAKQEAAAKAAAEKQNQSSSSNSSGSSNSSTSSGTPSSEQSSYGFIWPVNTKYPITTGWYYSSGSLHGAVDFSGSGISGTPIYAVADGYVVTSTAVTDGKGNYISYGNYILIAHFNGLYTLYAHCSQRNVSAGQTVTQGQVIGTVGSTGNSSGPHLHFEVRTSPGKYANRVSPFTYLP